MRIGGNGGVVKTLMRPAGRVSWISFLSSPSVRLSHSLSRPGEQPLHVRLPSWQPSPYLPILKILVCRFAIGKMNVSRLLKHQRAGSRKSETNKENGGALSSC